MQLPFRPKQIMKQLLKDEEPLYLTKEGIEKLERRLRQIEDIELPQAVEDVRRTGEFGDFSESAEYQEAKGRLRRLLDQQTTIKEKLKIVIEIEPGSSDVIQMGSHVVLRQDNGVQRIYDMVGPQEADPVKGKLSFKSPLGSKLMGRRVGEEIELSVPSGVIVYHIEDIS